ncbi:MAG: class I SAM-dependent methyltransferase [Bacteroidetes bacterium]|nr:class I SAM-dependent methyltransferase [Bacteroidota bacterium]
MQDIYTYYEALAPKYDEDRFDNSYGRFIHQQEVALLVKILADREGKSILDLACGTGRLSRFATHGTDQSKSMISIARDKNPGVKFHCSDALNMPFEEGRFDAIFAFHFVMHLEPEALKQVLEECARCLKPGGKLILDFPSAFRRKAIRFYSRRKNLIGWHAASAYSVKDWEKLCGETFSVVDHHGLLFLPVHRFPSKMRKRLKLLDQRLSRSFLGPLSSYLLLEMIKK